MPPAPVARGGGRGRASAVLVGIAALAALAIAKPWGASPPAVPDLSSPAAIAPSAATASATGTPSPSDVIADVTAGPAARSATAARVLDGGPVGRIGAGGIGAAGLSQATGPAVVGPDAARVWTAWDPARPTPSGAAGSAGTGDTLFGPLVARLSGHSGAWGIGSGGWGISPVSADPWTGWEPAAAIAVPRGPTDRDPPSCADLDWLRVGIVVAVTVPPGLPPDWTVDATRYDEDGVLVAGFTAAQVSPPGNRGIAYLVRPDGAQWRSGAYRFTVRTASSVLVLDACLIAL